MCIYEFVFLRNFPSLIFVSVKESYACLGGNLEEMCTLSYCTFDLSLKNKFVSEDFTDVTMCTCGTLVYCVCL